MKTNKFVANLKKVIESCQDEPCVGELLQILVLCDVFVFIRSNDTKQLRSTQREAIIVLRSHLSVTPLSVSASLVA